MQTISQRMQHFQAYLVTKHHAYKATVHIEWGEGITQADVWNGDNLVFQGRVLGNEADALEGALIDGVKLFGQINRTDERTSDLAAKMKLCHAGDIKEAILGRQAKKIGAYFYDWSPESRTYHKCGYYPGLMRLEAMGYDVVGMIIDRKKAEQSLIKI